MSAVVAALVAALAVGWSRGGRLSRLSRLALRSPALVGAAVAVQLAGALPVVTGAGSRALAAGAHAAGLAVSAGLVAVFLARNRTLPGLGLVALGLLSNALVVVANGAMPVSVAAAARAGAPLEEVAAGVDPRHELLSESTRWAVLADVLPLPLPVLPQVVSAGDVLVAAGVARLVVVGMGTGERAHPPAASRRHLPALPRPPAPPGGRRRLPPLPVRAPRARLLPHRGAGRGR